MWGGTTIPLPRETRCFAGTAVTDTIHLSQTLSGHAPACPLAPGTTARLSGSALKALPHVGPGACDRLLRVCLSVCPGTPPGLWAALGA